MAANGHTESVGQGQIVQLVLPNPTFRDTSRALVDVSDGAVLELLPASGAMGPESSVLRATYRALSHGKAQITVRGLGFTTTVVVQ